MIGEATEPLRESAVAPQVMAYLAGDPLTSFIAAAIIAWALHSSVATLLLLASFASAGLFFASGGGVADGAGGECRRCRHCRLV